MSVTKTQILATKMSDTNVMVTLKAMKVVRTQKKRKKKSTTKNSQSTDISSNRILAQVKIKAII